MTGRPILNIGGFFELEGRKGQEFHKASYSFSLGRHALSTVLIQRGIKTLHVPNYLCESLLDAARIAGAEAKFYNLKDLSSFDHPASVGNGEAVLLINYFGLLDAESLANKIRGCVILDNSQAFFAPPPPGVDTIYSARKFFGVPDGAYLYSDLNFRESFLALPRARAYDLIQHLVDRLDGHQADAFMAFQKVKAKYREMPISRISEASARILQGLNYSKCSDIRLQNFNTLKAHLDGINSVIFSPTTAPMYYPLLVPGGAAMRESLIGRGVFIPRYWPNVEKHSEPESAARTLADNLLCLPIDHRYCENDMNKIAAEALEFFRS